MRFTLSAVLTLAASAAQAFEPGTFGEPTEEEGYVNRCVFLEEGNACEIHARGAIFLSIVGGPSDPDAMIALAKLPQGAPVKFTGDMISMGDVTVDFALNTLIPNPEDPLAALVQGLQGTWTQGGKEVTIGGLEWVDAEVANYLISIGTGCSDGVDLGATHLSLYEMGGDPFTSICLEVVDQTDVSIGLRDVATGEDMTLTR